MKGGLDDYSDPDDLKVKKYNQDLVKFLNTKRKIVEETSSPDESAKDKTTETDRQTDVQAEAGHQHIPPVPKQRINVLLPPRRPREGNTSSIRSFGSRQHACVRSGHARMDSVLPPYLVVCTESRKYCCYLMRNMERGFWIGIHQESLSDKRVQGCWIP